jgi:hypothetical protein
MHGLLFTAIFAGSAINLRLGAIILSTVKISNPFSYLNLGLVFPVGLDSVLFIFNSNALFSPRIRI